MIAAHHMRPSTLYQYHLVQGGTLLYTPSHTSETVTVYTHRVLVVLFHSSSGHYLLTGLENGFVRIHQLAQAYSISSLESYWCLSMHDNVCGRITALTCTYDDKYLITAGADGNLFVYTTNLPAPARQRQPPVPQVTLRMYCTSSFY